MEYTQQSGYQQNKPSNNKKYTPFILIGVVVLLLIIFWSRITVTIPAGHGGVLYRLFGGGIDTSKTESSSIWSMSLPTLKLCAIRFPNGKI